MRQPVDIAFFLVSDTHYLADKTAPEKLDTASQEVTGRLIEQLNKLPGTSIPSSAGGGRVERPQFVIHGGDLIDSGDKNGGPYPTMQRTEWEGFVSDYGLTGKEGKLHFPVYEVYGNHDSPSGDGYAVQKLIERNRKRTGVRLSPNGLHYSWDKGGVHFIHLGIVVGAVPEVTRKRRYDPHESLAFLKDDLAKQVGKSGRPVVITHHVDVLRYALPPDPAAPASNKEWDACDVRGYYDTLKGYRIAAILYGHTHVRNIFNWNGTTQPMPQGLPTFNTDNAAHFMSDTQALLYFHLKHDTLTVREWATPDRWKSAAWTPQVWQYRISEPSGGPSIL